MKKILTFLLVIGAALAAWFLYLQDNLPVFQGWVQEQGLFGALVFGLGYAAATVLMIPGSLITLMAGVLYGAKLGTLLVSPASVLGATLAFLLGRSVFRDSIEKKMAGNAKFEALQMAMEKEGFKILTLVRLSPIFPFTLVNYAFGLTRVKLHHYVLGSFLGMLPGTFMYVYLGAAVGDFAKLQEEGVQDDSAAGDLIFWGGLAATIVVTVFVTRAAKKALTEAAPDAVAATPGNEGATDGAA